MTTITVSKRGHRITPASWSKFRCPLCHHPLKKHDPICGVRVTSRTIHIRYNSRGQMRRIASDYCLCLGLIDPERQKALNQAQKTSIPSVTAKHKVVYNRTRFKGAKGD